MAEPIASRPHSGDRADSQPTLPLEPLAEDGQADTQELPPLEPTSAPLPKRKRRRWIGWVIALVVAMGLGTALWFVGDSLARSFATDYIRERMVELLHLPSDKDVAVDLGEGSVLAQAISGKITEVTVAVDDVSFGELSGDLRLHGAGIPLASDQPTDELRATFSVAETDVERIAAFLSEAELQSIELEAPEIKVGSEFTFLGFVTVQLGVGLTPSAADGNIVFDPTSVQLGNDDISAEELLGGPLGNFASQFLASQSFCIAQHLPQALVLSDADVTGDLLVLEFTGDGTALGDPALTTLGACE